jgi:hypothetical protein
VSDPTKMSRQERKQADRAEREESLKRAAQSHALPPPPPAKASPRPGQDGKETGTAATESVAPENQRVVQVNESELWRWATCWKCGEQQWAPARKLFAWKCKNCQAKNNEHLRILLPRVRIYGSGIGASGMYGQFTFFKSGVGLTGGFAGERPLQPWNTITYGLTGGFSGERPLQPWNTITDFSIDDAEGFQKRNTATRIVAFDIFAAAVPKWQGTSHLTIRAGDEGWTAMFKMPPLTLEQKVLPARQLWEMYRPEQEVRESVQAQTEDIPSLIRGLGTLRDEG